MPGDKEWLTVAEAAKKSGIPIPTIQRWLRTGRIEGWKPGHDWFTTLEAVVEYKDKVKRGRPRKN
jgi:excisionase family DNA binding protein